MWPAHKHALLILYAGALKLISSISFFSSWRLLSLGTACAPCIGFFSGTSSCALLYLARTALSFSGTGSLLIHLPTLAGSISLTSSWNIARVIAGLCIIIFLAHPIGRESYLYSFYWLIPLAISFMTTPSIFLQSIMSTFVTHAVGSVIFIYTHETTSIFWHRLIPQVWLERLGFATILTVCYFVVTLTSNFIELHRAESSSCQNH